MASLNSKRHSADKELSRNEFRGVRMAVRFSPRILSTAFALCTLIFSAQSSAKDLKFQNEVQSVLGSVVNTKNGKMVLRQRKDSAGRVRRRIITGPGFSELQMDQDGDGTVDFLEVTRGLKTVTASSPSGGRFMRLETSMPTTKGRQNAVYILSLNGRSYNLLRSHIIPRSKRVAASGDEAEFNATDVPTQIESDAVISPSTAQSMRAGFDEQHWVDSQKSVFGEKLSCDDTRGEMNKLARLQREWWKVLKFTVDDQKTVLIDKLKNSSLFDDDCRKPVNQKDFLKMVDGLADIMLSGGSGQLSANETRGRYLACLDRSGLGIVSARIEKSFLTAMNDPYRLSAQIVCNFKTGKAAIAQPANTSTGDARQITMFMTAADEGNGKNVDGAVNNYANVLFHEFMHVGSFNLGNDEDEEHAIINSAEACCGDPADVGTRAVACQKLNGLVAKQARQTEVESYLSRVESGVTPMLARLENLFNSEMSKKLYHEYLMGLDNYKKGGPSPKLYAHGLLSDQQFMNCVVHGGATKASETNCRAQWAKDIGGYTDQFFSTKCRNIASADSAKCLQVTAGEKFEFAAAISKSVQSGFCLAEDAPKASASRKFFGVLFEKLFAGLIFGRNVIADDKINCETMPRIPTALPAVVQVPIGNEFPSYSDASTGVDGSANQTTKSTVADQVTSDTTAASGAGPDSSVGNATSGSGRVRSPIPVTHVDSSASGSTYAENEYRHATDIVGNTSRVYDRVKDSVLPTANASEGQGGSNVRRLTPEENYIPFKPDLPKPLNVKIANPFSAGRAIASVADFSGGLIKRDGGGASAKNISASTSNGRNVAASASSPDENANGIKLANGAKATRSVASSMASSSSAAVSKSSQFAAIQANLKREVAQPDVLQDLFTSTYRKIQPRLKSIDVIEALVRFKISIQDGAGRNLGSTRAVDQYKFDGLDKPLKKVVVSSPGKQ